MPQEHANICTLKRIEDGTNTNVQQLVEKVLHPDAIYNMTALACKLLEHEALSDDRCLLPLLPLLLELAAAPFHCYPAGSHLRIQIAYA